MINEHYEIEQQKIFFKVKKTIFTRIYYFKNTVSAKLRFLENIYLKFSVT